MCAGSGFGKVPAVPASGWSGCHGESDRSGSKLLQDDWCVIFMLLGFAVGLAMGPLGCVLATKNSRGLVRASKQARTCMSTDIICACT